MHQVVEGRDTKVSVSSNNKLGPRRKDKQYNFTMAKEVRSGLMDDLLMPNEDIIYLSERFCNTRVPHQGE